MEFSFGKHKGVHVASVPSDYLRWVLKNIEELDEDLEAEIERVLESRKPAKEKPKQQPPPTPLRIPSGVSAEIATEIVAAGRKTLARRHHPDNGGDLAVMQVVNCTADYLERAARNLPAGGGTR